MRLRILMCLNTAMSRRATRIKEQEGGFSDAIKYVAKRKSLSNLKTDKLLPLADRRGVVCQIG